MSSKNECEVNGCWELGEDGRYRCLWLICGYPTSSGFAGVICGYSGHGSFEFERFAAITFGSETTAFFFDFREAVSGREIRFDEDCKEFLPYCDLASDVIWNWNSWSDWEGSDALLLVESKYEETTLSSGIRVFKTIDLPNFRDFCSFVGLTAAPRS